MKIISLFIRLEKINSRVIYNQTNTGQFNLRVLKKLLNSRNYLFFFSIQQINI